MDTHEAVQVQEALQTVARAMREQSAGLPTGCTVAQQIAARLERSADLITGLASTLSPDHRRGD